ncbi:MAG: serine hydrolase [Balneola sp.]
MDFSYKTCSLTILLFAIIPTQINAQADWKSKLEGFIVSGMDSWSVPGLSIAIVSNEEILFIKGYGLADINMKEAVTPETVFPVGSLTKTFTSAAIGLLVDEKGLNWDDPIKDHIPNFHVQDEDIVHRVTVRDLLTHRTGLANHNLIWFAGRYDREHINSSVSFFGLQNGFRSRFEYNNIIYAYSAELIRQKKNISWDEFVANELFDPLNMDASSTNFEGLQNAVNKATGYILSGGNIKEIPYRSLDNIGPSGSINSSARDLAKWVILHLNKGEFDDRKLLDPGTISEMHNPQMVIPRQEVTLFFPKAKFTHYGLGWFVHDYKNEVVVEHSGNIDGMSAHIAMLPNRNIGVAILTNLNANFLPFAVKNKIFDIVLEESEFDWNRAFQQSFDGFMKMRDQFFNTPLSVENELLPSLNLRNYAGLYHSKSGESIEITLREENLILRYGKSSGVLEHKNFNTFLVEWEDPMIKEAFGPAMLTFELTKSGVIDKLNADGIGAFQKIGND